MAVFYSVESPFNFSNYQYIVVLNTSGNGVTPSTQTVQTNWAGYYYAMVARGNGFSSSAEAVQFRRSTVNPHTPPAWLVLGTTPTTFSYNPNANGAGTESVSYTHLDVYKRQVPYFERCATRGNNAGS